jgi:hypothetical protein
LVVLKHGCCNSFVISGQKVRNGVLYSVGVRSENVGSNLPAAYAIKLFKCSADGFVDTFHGVRGVSRLPEPGITIVREQIMVCLELNSADENRPQLRNDAERFAWIREQLRSRSLRCFDSLGCRDRAMHQRLRPLDAAHCIIVGRA